VFGVSTLKNLTDSTAVQKRVEAVRGILLHGPQRVRANLERRRDFLVAEPLLHDVRRQARLEQQGVSLVRGGARYDLPPGGCSRARNPDADGMHRVAAIRYHLQPCGIKTLRNTAILIGG
jgi:hypothetical protein